MKGKMALVAGFLLALFTHAATGGTAFAAVPNGPTYSPQITFSSITPQTTVAYMGRSVPGYITLTVKTDVPSRGSIQVEPLVSEDGQVIGGSTDRATIVLSMSEYKTEHVVNWAPYDAKTHKALSPGTYVLKADLEDQSFSAISGFKIGQIKVVDEPNPQPLIDTVSANPEIVNPKYNENGTVSTINYKLYRHAEVQIILRRSENGQIIETFHSPKTKLSPGQQSFKWNGRDDAGNIVPNGEYDILIKATELNYNNPSNTTFAAAFGKITVKDGESQIPLSRLQQVVTGASFDSTQFSPDGDGVSDTVQGKLILAEASKISLYITDPAGNNVKAIISDQNLPAGTNSFTWDGSNGRGGKAGMGTYGLRVYVFDQKGASGSMILTGANVNLKLDSGQDTPSSTTYTVVAGDTLWSIARKYSTAVEAIVKANSLDPDQYLVVGQKLVIPVPSVPGGGDPSGGSTVYTVQAGDTLWNIAQKKGTTVDAIVKANNLDLNKYLAVGQKLTIPAPGTPGGGQSGGSSVYTVQAGDTLWKIAQKNATTVDAIVRANNLNPDVYLTIGQKLTIPGTSSEVPVNPVYYTVQAGDTLWKIAQKNGKTVDYLAKLNQIDANKPIYMGQKLRLA